MKHNEKSQTTQTYKKQLNTKPGNTTSPSPPPKTSKAGTAAISSTSIRGQRDRHTGPPSSSSKMASPNSTVPLHTQMTRLPCIRGMGYWMRTAGATRTQGSPESCFYHVFIYPIEHTYSAGQPRGTQSTVISL